MKIINPHPVTTKKKKKKKKKSKNTHDIVDRSKKKQEKSKTMMQNAANITDEQLALIRRELECSICLSLMRAPCTLVPCGHAVDARCALELWRRAGARMLRCAVCRAECFMLVPAYQLRAQCEMIRAHRRARQGGDHDDDDDADDDDDGSDDDEVIDNDRLEAEMREYNSFFSRRHDESWWQTLKNNFSLGLRALRNVPMLPWLHQVAVVAVLILQVAYIVFPFDLLPEFQFGMIIGLIDDFIVAILLVIALGLIVRSLWTQQQRQRGQPQQQQQQQQR
jgi:uncharacterized membrane protein YkvA (DUF1232 family)